MNATKKKLRVLIVDDSSVMRKVLHGIIADDPQMEIVGHAKDGREAISMAESLKPDVITMDLNMPHMDGLQAIEHIMCQSPRPIVVVSSESREGAASALIALELGAIDFVSKPSGGLDFDMKSVAADLNRKLKTAAKVRVIRTAARPKHRSLGVQHTAGRAETSNEGSDGNATGGRFPIVVIAASTGGPATVMHLATAFPANFPAAVVLVQHMPWNFTSQYAMQLAEVTEIEVKEAQANETLRGSILYVCPGSHHLRISSLGRIVLDEGPRISGYLPCADVTMETAAKWAGHMTIGIVLTGMGNDGAQGAQAIRAAGGIVIAQDEATSVIFGMPAEAIKTGAVNQVLPLDQIFPVTEKHILQIARSSQAMLR